MVCSLNMWCFKWIDTAKISFIKFYIARLVFYIILFMSSYFQHSHHWPGSPPTENENSQRHNQWEVKQTNISFPGAELENSTASKEKITKLFCFRIYLFFFNNFQQPHYVQKILFHSSTPHSLTLTIIQFHTYYEIWKFPETCGGTGDINVPFRAECSLSCLFCNHWIFSFSIERAIV